MSSIKVILLQEKVERRIRRGIKNGLWEVVDLKKKEGRKEGNYQSLLFRPTLFHRFDLCLPRYALF